MSPCTLPPGFQVLASRTRPALPSYLSLLEISEWIKEVLPQESFRPRPWLGSYLCLHFAAWSLLSWLLCQTFASTSIFTEISQVSFISEGLFTEKSDLLITSHVVVFGYRAAPGHAKRWHMALTCGVWCWHRADSSLSNRGEWQLILTHHMGCRCQLALVLMYVLPLYGEIVADGLYLFWLYI